MVLTTVLFNETPEVDAENLQGLQAGGAEVDRALARPAAKGVVIETSAASPLPSGEGSVLSEPALRLRRALAREIANALEPTTSPPAPIGKWLAEDLILAADRLS